MLSFICLNEPIKLLLCAIAGLIVGCLIITTILYPRMLGRMIALICVLPIIIFWDSIVFVVILLCYVFSNLIFLGIYGATGDPSDIKGSYNILKWIKHDEMPWFKIHLKTPHEKTLKNCVNLHW